jgi:hypothetical protein
LREALDIAYVLMVEEAGSRSRSIAEARALVDNVLLDPETRAMREDQAAMRMMLGAAKLPRVGRSR